MAETNLISYQVKDFNNHIAQVHIYVPTGLTVAQLVAFSDLAAADLDTIIGATIEKASVTLDLGLPEGLKGTAVDSQPVEEGANLAFDAANTAYRWTQRVPSLLDEYYTEDTVILADSDITAWTARMTAGDLTVLPCDRYGNDLTDVLSGVKTFRKS